MGRRAARMAVVGAVVAAAGAACAGTLPPPGGPLRKEPPIILFFLPETNSVNVRPHAAVFQFDEVVSERPQGTSTLDGLFLISPRSGDPNVDWHRSHISVSPRHGFRPNTVYTITMLPGLVDLHNNVRKTGAVLTFSTGSTIPATAVRGRVFDWQTGLVAPRAFVQALVRKDTNTVYVTVADSTGAFILRHLPPGEYLLRGFVDANTNRTLDRTEIWDSTGVTLTDSARVELLAFLHDTIGPRISEVDVHDSVTLRVMFDRGIDSSQHISAALFTLKDKDSTTVPITVARSAAEFDSVQGSVARLHSDSLLRADSLRRVDSGLAPRDTAAARERRQRLASRRDSTLRSRAPKPSRPSPVKEVVIQLGAPIHAGTYYRLQAIDMRGLLGRVRSSDRVFSVPKPAAADSAGAGRAAPGRGRKPTPAGAAPTGPPGATPSATAPSSPSSPSSQPPPTPANANTPSP
jgi:hypothetical protein